MQNKLTVTIDDQSYTLVADQDPEYMKKVAEHVDAKIRELRAGGRVNAMDAAVLAALNIADEYFHLREDGVRLRGQIKGYVEEASELKKRLSEAMREIVRLQNQKR